MADIKEIIDQLEPVAAICGSHVGTVGEAALVSLAVSAQRIAASLEEMSRPTLPPPADLRKTAEREAKALEDIRDMMRGLVGGRTILRVAQR